MATTKITTPELFDFSATNTALQLPTGTTAQRPTSPSAGEWRFNTTEKYVEYWDGGAWKQIDTESSAVPPVPNENFNINTYFGNGASQTIDAKFNEAANFDGASSYIQIANNSFTYTTMTFSAWVNPSANDTYNYIFQIGMYDNRIGGSIGWYVRRESGGSLLARGFSSNSLSVAEFDVTSASSLIPLNTWTNVVCVLTPTSFNIYINGNSTAVASATFSNAITYSASQPSAVVIGANYYYFNAAIYESWWEGAIDQVRIFNTALTSAQVEDLYTDETTTTAATLDFPAGAGCQAAYQLDGNANDISTNYNGTPYDIGYTGLLFQPDFVWIKSISNATSHELHDSVRGEPSRISSDTTAAASTTYNGFVALTSNGFNLDGAGSGGEVNTLGRTYVSWCFKGGGAASQNNDGSITGANCLVSANADAGFSIVKYTAGSATSQSIGHGLTNLTPKLVLIKKTSGPEGWIVWYEGAGTDNWLELNSANQKGTGAGWGGVPTSLVVHLQDSNAGRSSGNGATYIAYCFADIADYQKIGTYTWTGTSYTAGTLVTGLGFTPRFVMIKRTNGTAFWQMYDNSRVSGTQSYALYANASDAESTSGYQGIIFDSDGFSAGAGADGNVTGTDGVNVNGGTYIYLAIA